MNARALHYVFKISDRQLNAKFFRKILGMKVLRHEEFNEGCEAACNGPYDNRWSKTMIGYGPEDNHFVMELTWNTGVSSYARGNDFFGVTIQSREAIARAKAFNWPVKEVESGLYQVDSPDGYPFYLVDQPQPADKDPVHKVTLGSTNIEKTVAYWGQILGMTLLQNNETKALFTFGEDQANLEFQKIDEPIDHKTAYGRIAFSVPKTKLREIESKVVDHKYKVLTPLISLDTPGKATVTVVILADPDGHEIFGNTKILITFVIMEGNRRFKKYWIICISIS